MIPRQDSEREEQRSPETLPLRVFLHTLGCLKNDVDTQRFASLVEAAGGILVSSVEEADWAFVNTCGFIVPAIEESLQAIFALEELKEKGALEAIGVVGCLYSRFGEKIVRELPLVDHWIPCEGWKEFASCLKGSSRSGGDAALQGELPPRILTREEPFWARSLKIVEGCENRCTYCTIPDIRGKLRSLSPGKVLQEARELVDQGARELSIIGQDITRYGMDFSSGETDLLSLLRKLGETLPRDIWFRLLYLHPRGITPAFWKELAEIPQVIPYADIPIQHADENILRRMNRNDSLFRLEELFAAAREFFPSMVLRTTVMVGFPGEDERAFEVLLDFLRKVRFHRLGAFIYSPEERTPAAAFPCQVPPDVAAERLERVMALQAEISLEHQKTLEGTLLEVVVEEQEGELLFGRSFREAPDVDGNIEMILPQGRAISPGDRVSVRVVEAMEHDLRGEIL